MMKPDNKVTYYEPRPGTQDSGKQYEVAVTALLALQYSHDPNIKHFYFSINNELWGDFDDSVLEIEDIKGQKIVIAMQLKHTRTNLSLENVTKGKGDFSLRKYHNSFEKIQKSVIQNQKESTVYYVLISTSGFSDKINLFEWFYDDNRTSNIVKKVECSNIEIIGDLFEKLGNTGVKFRFISSGDFVSNFLNKFFIFTAQSNLQKIKYHIMQVIKQKYCTVDDLSEDFLHFFTKWSRGEIGGFYKLSKGDVLLKLHELLLLPHILKPNYPMVEMKKKCDIWWKAVMNVGVTIIQEHEPIILPVIWSYILKVLNFKKESAVNSWFVSDIPITVLDQITGKVLPKRWVLEEKEGPNISLNSLYLINWKCGLIPLVLRVDSKSLPCIKNVLKHTPDGVRFILNTEKLNHTELDSNRFRVFSNLYELKFISRSIFETILKIPLRIQDRFDMTLSELPAILLEEITPNLLWNILNKDSIGATELITDIYIERKLSEFHVEIECLKFIRNNLVFIFCELQHHYIVFSKMFPDRSLDFIPFDLSSSVYQINGQNIYLVPYGVSVPMVRKFSSTNYHIFLLTEKNKTFYLKWMESTAPIDFLKKFQTRQNNLIDESDIFEFSHNCINVISDLPGMGKSLLLNRLCINCPEKSWVLKIDLFKNSKYFRTSQDIEPLNYFHQQTQTAGRIESILFQHFREKKRLMIFIDEFDEISAKYSGQVLKLSKDFRREGLKQWITTRPASVDIFQSTFNILALRIAPFDEDDMNSYIEKYSMTFPEDQRKELVNSFNQTLRSKCINVPQSFQSIPLHLNMLGETLRRIQSSSPNVSKIPTLDVIDLYENFIDTKFSISEAKVAPKAMQTDSLNKWSRIVLGCREHYRNLYQLSSLITVFSKENVWVRELTSTKQIEAFFREIQNGQEDVGIIYDINDEGIPIFSHRVYAEYFASTWLAQNWRKTEESSILLLWESSNKNVRRFFDLNLGKKIKVFQAIFNDNLNQLKQHSSDEILKEDDGGRNCLHLACSWSRSWRILEYLLTIPRLDVQSNDKVFNLNAIQYADKARNVIAIEQILAKGIQVRIERFEMIKDVKNFIYRCIRKRCVRTLKLIAHHVNSTIYWNVTRADEDLLFAAVETDDATIVEALLSINIFRMFMTELGNGPLEDTRRRVKSFTPIDIAVLESRGKVLTFLKRKRASSWIL